MDLLFEHSKHPVHWGAAPGGLAVTVTVPGCGDRQRLGMQHLADGSAVVLFQATGCSLSRASTSVLLDAAEDLVRSEVLALDRAVVEDLLGIGVVRSRPQCALLGLRALCLLATDVVFTRLSRADVG